MSEMYFTRDPSSASRPGRCSFSYRGRMLEFQTDAGVFSRDGLDPGSRLLLDCLPGLSGPVLDLGCGWGPIGIAVAAANPAAAVTLADVNRRALSLSEQNAHANGVSVRCAESDGFAALPERFAAVITNPPIRAGKQVIYGLFTDARAHLLPGGALYLVIRKQQGAESCLRFLSGLYPRVQALKKAGGYWVLRADKEESP